MSKMSDSYINKLIQDQKPINLHLRNGAKLTAILVNHDSDTFYLSDGVAEKISKSL